MDAKTLRGNVIRYAIFLSKTDTGSTIKNEKTAKRTLLFARTFTSSPVFRART